MTRKRFDGYMDLLLTAATDETNPYKNNYKSDLIPSSVFITVLCHRDVPIGMFGLYQDPDLPDNVARGFNRLYRRPDLHADVDRGKNHWQNRELWRYLDGEIYNFYNNYPHHTDFGIDTVFFTRNYISGKKNSMENILKRFNTPYIAHPQILLYRSVPQFFYTWGDDSFLKELKSCNP